MQAVMAEVMALRQLQQQVELHHTLIHGQQLLCKAIQKQIIFLSEVIM